MFLQRPEQESPSSRLADWLELLAAARPQSAVGGGELQKILRMEGEERVSRRRRDEDTGEIEDEEILERDNAEMIRDVFEEITRRAVLLKSDYPFLVEFTGRGLGTKARLRRKTTVDRTSGALAYLYCLLISARRHTLLLLGPNDETLAASDGLQFHSEHRYGHLLQICAAIALGGYLKNDVISFGYPRPDGSKFLEAHKRVWDRFGAYKPCVEVPIGAPDKENDAGIDLIGWVSFPDSHASKILIFGQVASGRNWAGKSAIDRANALHTWFDSPAYKFFIPAMVMPFNITDARTTIRRGRTDLRRAVFEHEERQFGIVIDRDRLSTCVTQALTLDATIRDRIEGIDQFGKVVEWVTTALQTLQDID